MAVPGAAEVRRTAIAVCVMAVIVSVAGCDTTSDAGPPRLSEPSATRDHQAPETSTAAGEAAERAAVEAAYRQFWRVSETFDQRYPEARWRTVLGRVAADPQLGLVLANTRTQRRAGIKVYGHVVPHVTVLPINGGSRARVTDCQDASKSGQADARTGQPRTVGVPRNPVEAVLVRGADGLWRVSSIKYPGGTC